MKQQARFYNRVEDGFISSVREVVFPMRRVVHLTGSTAIPERYRLRDYGMKLELQEERYVRVYLHDPVARQYPEDPALLQKIAADFGWPAGKEVIFKRG